MQLNYKQTSLISEDEIKQEGERLTPYIERLQQIIKDGNYESPEASINLPNDETVRGLSQTLANKYATDELQVIFVVGIGGSNLGTKAIYDALIGHFSHIETGTHPRVIFLDTINPSYLSQLKAYIAEHDVAPEQYLINMITKSGATAETIVTVETLITMLPDVKSRLVVTTEEGSVLDKMASDKKLPLLHLPKHVGGRFSVFSNVGLFPLALAGVSIDELVSGAKQAIEQNTSMDILNNPSAQSAIIVYLLNKKGYAIHDNFFFNAELESVGKWYRQLTGESIGKEGKGIFPTVSIGSTDLHSMVQLYLGGPKNVITTFFWAGQNLYRSTDEPEVPETPEFSGLVSDVNGKKPSDVLKVILKGTEAAYEKKGMPFMEITLENISEKSLGELLQYKMIEMMYLGNLLGINTFDQPNVEDYKEETRRLLKGS